MLLPVHVRVELASVKRNMEAARQKILNEGRCRVCGTTHDLDPCHVIPRSRLTAKEGAEDPRNIVVLCRKHHEAQHRGELELLSSLTREEQAYVVSLVGLGEAWRRVTA